MLANLKPLEDAAVERLTTWLPKLSHPIRIGEHNQTAFALGLLLDCARVNFIYRIRIVRSLTSRREKIFFRPASAKPT